MLIFYSSSFLTMSFLLCGYCTNEMYARRHSETNKVLVQKGSIATFSTNVTLRNKAKINFMEAPFIYIKRKRMNKSEIVYEIQDHRMEKKTDVKVENETLTITIRDVEKADNGTYTLKEGHRKFHFVLFVFGIDQQPVGPIEEHSPTYFKGYPKPSEIRQISGNATVVWLVDDRNVSQDPQFVVQDGKIWIPSVSRTLNRKNITYRVIHGNGSTLDAIYTVEVKYGPETPPLFTPNKLHYFLSRGDVMSNVTCSIDCNPRCNISWNRFGVGNLLSLGKVTTSNAGEYVCMAKRPGVDFSVKKSLTVHVAAEEPPLNIQLSPNRTIYILSAGEKMPKISCTADCYPPCEISWGVNSNKGELSLGVVSEDMSGEYTCTAKMNDIDKLAAVKIILFVQDNTEFTIAIVTLASILAVMIIVILGLCGLFIYRRDNAFTCILCILRKDGY